MNEPEWRTEARKYLGLTEIKGPDHHPQDPADVARHQARWHQG